MVGVTLAGFVVARGLQPPHLMAAQQAPNFDNVEIRVLQVRENIHMLVGAGGNITVQTGPVANVASGVGQRAVTSVGSVTEGTRLAGQNEVVISTGQIINMSDPSGRPACVVVGSFGTVPGC